MPKNSSLVKNQELTQVEKEKSSGYVNIAIPKFAFLRTTNGFLTIVLIIFAFMLGMLTNKVLYLEGAQKANTTSPSTVQAANNAQAPQAVPTEDLSPKKVSIDDDPILGDKNAKVTIIEFSDYECPFCKQFYDDTLSQLKKEYIDTGKVKLVYRDLPLSFHQNAPKEAEAAECAREQGGDEIYFKYHDEIFKRTTSNGTGLALDQLPIIADDLGLNGNDLQACLDGGKYKAEVDKDIANAGSVGASGTPSFFIGKSSSNGTIIGTPLIGAQPLSSFKTVIDQQLK